MKRNKMVSLILVGSISVFALMGCNSKGEDQDIVENNETPVSTPINEEVVETPIDQPETNVENASDGNVDLDPLDAMIESSDYISKIKLIQKGQDSKEIKILDNIKANLSESNLPEIANLELNRSYVVFFKDLDGKVVLTDANDGVILLEGDNHELFEKINADVHK